MGLKGEMQKMAVLDKAEELALAEYNVTTVEELRISIVNAEFQRTIDKQIDEAKKRIVRQKQDEAKAYEPTDEEIEDRLLAKINTLN